MDFRNSVFIATSLDGYIADRNGGLDWLHSVPNPDQQDLGYESFISEIDAIVMGRTTFEVVCGFDIEWPYQVPVFVLSSALYEIPEKLSGKVELVKGKLLEVLDAIHQKGYYKLYIDGGTTIQGFLKEDLIDDMIITTIPVLLGGGFSLFGNMLETKELKLIESKVFLSQIVQNHYRLIRSK